MALTFFQIPGYFRLEMHETLIRVGRVTWLYTLHGQIGSPMHLIVAMGIKGNKNTKGASCDFNKATWSRLRHKQRKLTSHWTLYVAQRVFALYTLYIVWGIDTSTLTAPTVPMTVNVLVAPGLQHHDKIATYCVNTPKTDALKQRIQLIRHSVLSISLISQPIKLVKIITGTYFPSTLICF